MVTLKLLPDLPCQTPIYNGSQFDIHIDNVMEYSQKAVEGTGDMVEIDELNHATLLYNMFSRYSKDQIYTYVGPILLAVNPFKNVDQLYTSEKVESYK